LRIGVQHVRMLFIFSQLIGVSDEHHSPLCNEFEP
jgi:hypothetical protein